LIDGSNIANVLFDSSAEIKVQAGGTKVLDDAPKSKLERLAQDKEQVLRRACESVWRKHNGFMKAVGELFST
jgi:hypothetical protein